MKSSKKIPAPRPCICGTARPLRPSPSTIRAWVRATNHSREWAVGQVVEVTLIMNNEGKSQREEDGR